MELKEIQELIKMVKKADICELKIREGDFAITIKNKGSETVYATPQVSSAPMVAAGPQPVQKNEAAAEQSTEQTAAAEVKSENQITFRSPMVGTFYRKPSADKDVYVKVGDLVKGGDVLCIIEAMKLFNEIEFDGGEARIVKILVQDASPVEYDQPLFLIEKI